jgi:hypothetical protein
MEYPSASRSHYAVYQIERVEIAEGVEWSRELFTKFEQVQLTAGVTVGAPIQLTLKELMSGRLSD